MGTFGRTPDETIKVAPYRHYMIDKIRRYHASYLGWISDYDATDSPAACGKPNIIVIYTDDQGYGGASCYNLESKIQTPLSPVH